MSGCASSRAGAAICRHDAGHACTTNLRVKSTARWCGGCNRQRAHGIDTAAWGPSSQQDRCRYSHHLQAPAPKRNTSGRNSCTTSLRGGALPAAKVAVGVYSPRPPDEGGGVLELPADDGVPLVQPQRQVPVAADPLGVEGVHRRLAGGPDGQMLLQLVIPATSHPRHLRRRPAAAASPTLPSLPAPKPCVLRCRPPAAASATSKNLRAAKL